MADGRSSDRGRLSLGQRVHQLEHDQAQTRKELKRIKAETSLGPEDDVTSWVGRTVQLITARDEEVVEGVLRKVRRYTYLVETEGGPEIVNKSLVFRVRPLGT